MNFASTGGKKYDVKLYTSFKLSEHISVKIFNCQLKNKPDLKFLYE